MDLLFDTETTGFAPKGCTDPTDRRQPHALQIALAHRIPSTGELVNAAKFILIPKDPTWICDPAAEAVHGLSRTKIELCGIPAEKGLALFRIMAQSAQRLVAHNIAYDWAVLLALAWRSNIGLDDMPKLPRFCTMEASRSACALPMTEKQLRAGFTGYKKPKLIEAYCALVDPAGFASAHDAFADLTAMSKILDKLEAPQ